eukprot:scaffold6847_cov64-Phaeocystis_antarctica.AAC.12
MFTGIDREDTFPPRGARTRVLDSDCATIGDWSHVTRGTRLESHKRYNFDGAPRGSVHPRKT